MKVFLWLAASILASLASFSYLSHFSSLTASSSINIFSSWQQQSPDQLFSRRTAPTRATTSSCSPWIEASKIATRQAAKAKAVASAKSTKQQQSCNATSTPEPYRSFYTESQLSDWNLSPRDLYDRMFESTFLPAWVDESETAPDFILPLVPSPEFADPTLPVCDDTRVRDMDLELSGEWTLRDGWEPYYTPTTCFLRRILTVPVNCLRGQRWMFFGDSLMRYQFLSMMKFIAHGTWLFPGTRPPYGPSLVQETAFGPSKQGWIEFHKRTVQELAPYFSYERIVSDDATDHRCDGCLWRFKHPEYDFEALWIMSPGLSPKSRTVTPAFDVALNLEGVRQVMTHVGWEATMVMSNVGVWDMSGVCFDGWGMEGYEILLERTAQYFQGWKAAFPKTELIWRASTWHMRYFADCYAGTEINMGHPNRWHATVEGLIKLMAEELGFGYLDAFTMTKELIAHHGITSSWDPIHFHAFMYHTWNTLFLTRQCPGLQ